MTVDVDTPGLDDPGPGRRLAIDVGKARIGVASCNREATLATPVETVQRIADSGDSTTADIERIIALIAHYDAVELIVGLPRTLKGKGSTSANDARDFAARLRSRTDIPIRLADERLTTVAATHALRSSGVSAKKGRGVIDQAAAVEILQSWLDARASARNRGDMEASPRPTILPSALASREHQRRTTP